MLQMRKVSRWGTAALAAAACFALISCKDQSQPAAPQEPVPSAGGASAGAPAALTSAFDTPRRPTGTVKIRIITNNSSSFWTAMAKGMEAAKAEIADVDASWQSPPGAQPTHADQKAVFEQVLASNVDGIAVSPIEASAFAPVIDAAVEKGIPVITFDSDSEKSKRLVYLGTNNYEAGRRAGEMAVKLLPNGGKFVAFVGNMSAQNARDRYQGFLDAVKGHNITMLQEPYQDKADKTGAAFRNVQDAILKHGDKINGFLGIWSYNGPAIVDEVVKAGIRDKVKIICFDGDPKTLLNLRNGKVDATVVQKPYEFGRLSTKLLYLINRKGLKGAMEELKPELEKMGMQLNGSVIDTGVEVITPENCGPFLERLKKLGLETT